MSPKIRDLEADEQVLFLASELRHVIGHAALHRVRLEAVYVAVLSTAYAIERALVGHLTGTELEAIQDVARAVSARDKMTNVAQEGT